MLLSPEMRARLERLALSSRKRVGARWAGRHASIHRGESIDFADYRGYVPGDDYRRIDHSLWARLGQLLVRQFEAEEEMPVRIVLDVSRSMQFGAKLPTARVLAATIAYLALAGGDRVMLTAFPGDRDRPRVDGPSGRHLSAWRQIESWLEEVPAGGAVSLAPVIRTLAGAGARRQAVALVSDLLDPEWERALDGLAVGAGGVVIHLLDREELEPDLVGDLLLVDSETGAEVAASASEAGVASYRASLDRFVEGTAGRARRSGLDYVLVPALPDAPDRLLSSLIAAEAVR